MLHYAVADIAGVCVEIFFFGIYSLLFCICLWVIYHKRNLNIFLSSAALVSYTLSATYVVLDLIRVANSYTVDPKRPWVMTYVSDHINTVNYIASSTYIANALVADGVLIWRCYAVWGRDIRICSLSILLWFGTGIGSSGSVWYMSRLPQTGIIGPVAQRWGNASIGTAIAMNALTTGLIAGRVWWHKRNVEKAFGDHVRHTEYYDWVIAIVIESGAVYTACLICELVLYRMNNSGTFIIVGVLSQVVGIVPTMIIVCAALGRTLESSHYSAANSGSQPTTSSQRERDRAMSQGRTTGTLTFDIGPTASMVVRNDGHHHYDANTAAGDGIEAPGIARPIRVSKEMSPAMIEEGLEPPIRS